MTNRDVYNYKNFSVCDGHFHLSFPYSVDDSVTIFRNVMEYFNYGETCARFGLGSGVGQFHSLAVKEKFIASIADASFSASTCHAKCSNHAKNEVANVLKFGVQ